MVSSASHPDHVGADESDADAAKGIAARALTSPTSRGKSRYLDLTLNDDVMTEGVGIINDRVNLIPAAFFATLVESCAGRRPAAESQARRDEDFK